ncbi:MAG: hypothetical protein HYU33_02840 [Candidatus Omnitrophica bacterium]|nr:hypothetical protein [Candidatus Omnitrophota bacterium]
MCGIVGYWGRRNAGSILLQAIRNLEYRGYDSVGICTSNGEILAIRKDKGKVEEVNGRHSLHEMTGNIGIAHTRWATTGKVTKKNAHPHTDCTKSIAVVHNGIIENYERIRERLRAKGHAFQSETDTETIAHLLEENIHLGIGQAMISVAKELEGRNAFVALFGNEGVIAGVRKGEERQVENLFLVLDTLVLSSEIGRKAGQYLNSYSRSHGVELADALVAATAHFNKIPLWSLNKRHYPMRDIRFFSPGQS